MATTGAAGLTCLARRDVGGAAALALAALPVAAALGASIAASLPVQMAVATPHGCIIPPNLADLLRALTGSGLLSLALLVALFSVLGSLLVAAPRRDVAALYAALAAYAALTLAGWASSQAITPFFVPRYFGPNLVVAVLVLVPAAEAARRLVGPADAFPARLGPRPPPALPGAQ